MVVFHPALKHRVRQETPGDTHVDQSGPGTGSMAEARQHWHPAHPVSGLGFSLISFGHWTTYLTNFFYPYLLRLL